MNFNTFLKFSKIQYQKFLTVIFATVYLVGAFNKLLSGNNGLLLILTPNNTDLTLTCDC